MSQHAVVSLGGFMARCGESFQRDLFDAELWIHSARFELLSNHPAGESAGMVACTGVAAPTA